MVAHGGNITKYPGKERDAWEGKDAIATLLTLSIFQNRQRRSGGVVLMRDFSRLIDLGGPNGPWPEFTFFFRATPSRGDATIEHHYFATPHVLFWLALILTRTWKG